MEFLQKLLELDSELFLFLNSFNSDFWDTIMLMITRKETWLPFYLVILFFILKNYKNKWWLVLIFLAVTILLSDQLSVLLKETIQRLRPVHNPDIQHMVHNVLRKGGLFSFVSSHATNSFAFFVFTSRIFRNRGYWFLMFIWALLISYSRIYSGVHYPLDILGGAVLGWIIAVGTHKMLMFFENFFFIARRPKIETTNLSSKQMGLIFLVFMVLSATVVITTYILHNFNFL
jgi:undecaprenyl-diphosphatase